ncbi:MAG TPA: ABC transporter permease [Ktedonobacterales bacterium]|jgi:ABC-2 type transport system permease protein
MKVIWYVAKKDLVQAITDRGSLLLLLAVPLVLIAVIGFALGNIFGSGSAQISMTVALDNQDSGYVGTAVSQALHINTSQLVITVNTYHTATEVQQQVKDGNAIAGVVVPAGTSDTLTTAAQQNTQPGNLVQFYSVPGSTDQRVAIAQQIVTGIVNQLVIQQYAGAAAVNQVEQVCHQPGNTCAPSTIDPATIARMVGAVTAQATQTAQVALLAAGQATQVDTFDQIVPGYAVFFALFSINAAAATILQEKEDGTFRRLLIAPIHKYSLLGGKLLAQFLLTLLQLVILFGAGYLVFHMHIGSWPGVILLVLGASFAATGLGILLVSVVKTRRQLAPVVTLVTLITSAIGGAWWPLFLEPTWMQQIAKVGLTAWAMEGLNGVMIFGKDVAQILPDILGLFAYGAICFIIAMRFFRFQEKVA